MHNFRKCCTFSSSNKIYICFRAYIYKKKRVKKIVFKILASSVHLISIITTSYSLCYLKHEKKSNENLFAEIGSPIYDLS